MASFLQRAPLTILFALILMLVAQPLRAASCPPPSHDHTMLAALKAAKFEIENDAQRQALALALLPCLAHQDPAMRDGIAFEAYFSWLRAGRVDLETRTRLLKHLSTQVAATPDKDGFRQPFAALVLAEVARTDRLEAWMTTAQRSTLVNLAANYLAGVRDYRGFDPRDGWRHGVAHGADLAVQLVLNPAVDRAGMERLLAAVAVQVAPPGEHSYIHGEPERLARSVLFAAQRGLLTASDWETWLGAVAAPLPDAAAAMGTRTGLARQHNLQAFLYALYVNASESGNDNMRLLLPGVKAAFKAL
jgi:hypothetical protein